MMLFTIIKHTRGALGGRANLSHLLAAASRSPVPAMNKITPASLTFQSISGPFPNFSVRGIRTFPNPSGSSFSMGFPRLAGLASIFASGVSSTAESKTDASSAEDLVTYLNVRHQARITRAVEEQRAYEKLPKIKKAIASMLESAPLESLIDDMKENNRVSINIPKEDKWILTEDESTKKLFLEEIAAVYHCDDAEFWVQHGSSILCSNPDVVRLRFYDPRVLKGWAVKDETSKQLQQALDALIIENPPAILLEKAALSYDIALPVPDWIFKTNYRISTQFENMVKREFKCDYVFLSCYSNTVKISWR